MNFRARKSIDKSLDEPGKSAVELTIEALIAKIDKMEKDHKPGFSKRFPKSTVEHR